MASSGRYMKGVTPNTLLPPSVEAAYYKKCIALKRRITEMETHNDEIRQRKIRIDRAILKMRLERALFLEQLSRRTDENVDDSDLSDSPPPTPTDRPLRVKRGGRRAGSPSGTAVQGEDKFDLDGGSATKEPKTKNRRSSKSFNGKRARSSDEGAEPDSKSGDHDDKDCSDGSLRGQPDSGKMVTDNKSGDESESNLAGDHEDTQID